MNDSMISTAINNLRGAADRCPTCDRPAAAPARRVVAGEIREGCVDAFHHGHLTGADLAWHERPAAQQLRAQTLAAMPEPPSVSECLRLLGM